MTYGWEVVAVGTVLVAVGGHSSEGSALRVVERYPAGGRVRVFVCPGDASEAVLETGVKAGSIFLLAIGIIGIIVGLKFT